MAFNEYRDRRKDSESFDLDIERFAYDVFAYMLTICGFPKAKIPVTIRYSNNYAEDNIIMNIGLSVVPIALFMRDTWKPMFESKLEETGFKNILELEGFLEEALLNCPDYDEEDTLTRIQFSLALYNEMILFFNYKGIETYFDSLPKSWSRMCVQLIAQSDNGEQLETLLTMEPFVSETWITKFVRKEAIPYGSSDVVSYKFSIYSLEHEAGNEFKEKVTDIESVSSDSLSEPSLPEDYNSELYFLPGSFDCRAVAGKFQGSEDNVAFAEITHTKHTNGLTYVLNKCLKGRKRSRSLKVEVEDAFKGISLEKGNISPEKQDIKRRRKLSNKKEL